jgi:hypothetical protein
MTETVDVEFIGDPPILDEVTKFRIAVGEIHPEAAAVIRAADIQRVQRVQGITKRVVDPDGFPGCKGAYVFGPSVFVVAVDRRDVDVILGSGSGHQFQIVGDPANDIVRPAHQVHIIEEVEGRTLGDVF